MKSLRIIGCGVVIALLMGAGPQSHATNGRLLILLIGPTGSGKTTQAEFLKERFGIPTIAADDLIQANPAEMPKYRRPGIASGPPQFSPALDTLVAEKLTRMDLTKGVVLDGYPATKSQADHLAGLIVKLNLPDSIVIQIGLPDEVARQRLKERPRDDDKPELIEERLKNYHREMDMIVAYYPQASIWSIDGNKPVAEVSSTIEGILKDQLQKR